MDLEQNEICRRIIDTWINNINARIDLYDKTNNTKKMRILYEDYFYHVSLENEEDEFEYNEELTEIGWELFNEIKHFLPSYRSAGELIEDTYGADADNEVDKEMGLEENEICRRIIDAWINNIKKRVKLHDKNKMVKKMYCLYTSYYNYLNLGRTSDVFANEYELSKKGWELFNEIEYFLPSYISLDKLIESNFGFKPKEWEPTPF